jgi:hypothetical protein
MPKSQPPKPRKKASASKAQSRPDDFVSVARRLECDEDKKRFEAKLGKIARAKGAAEK